MALSHTTLYQSFHELYWIATFSGNYLLDVDDNTQRIKQFSRDGNFITKWGSQGHLPDQFYYPYGVNIQKQVVCIIEWTHITIEFRCFIGTPT